MSRTSRARFALWAAPLLALPALTGCFTTYGQAQAYETAVQEDMALMQEQNRRLQGRLEGLELEIERLRQQVDLLRSTPNAASLADVQALQTRVASVDQQLKALDAARERDRQEIISTLTTKITQLVGASGGSRPKPAATTARKSAGPQEGYEHKVEAGQTLSAIAAAYNVSSKAIIEANGLDRPDQLRVGQTLFIPAP